LNSGNALNEAPNGGNQLQKRSIMLDNEKFIRKLYTYAEGQGTDMEKFVSMFSHCCPN
jgi:hypothetical protein